jgi:hypothetical protein
MESEYKNSRFYLGMTVGICFKNAKLGQVDWMHMMHGR